MSDQPMTHAAALVAFRQELIDGGFMPDEAHDLSKVALAAILDVDAGLYVRDGWSA